MNRFFYLSSHGNSLTCVSLIHCLQNGRCTRRDVDDQELVGDVDKDCAVVHHSSTGRIVFASGAALSHLEHIPQETKRTQKETKTHKTHPARDKNTQKDIPQETKRTQKRKKEKKKKLLGHEYISPAPHCAALYTPASTLHNCVSREPSEYI